MRQYAILLQVVSYGQAHKKYRMKKNINVYFHVCHCRQHNLSANLQ